MSLTTTGRNTSPLGNPLVQSYDLAASQTINPGDWVVLTNAGSVIRVRKLASGDISAHFTVSGSVAGVLGIAMFSAVTNSSGVSNGSTTPSYVAAGAAPIYPIPNYSSSIDGDPVAGVSRLDVAVTDSNASFIMRAQTTSNAAVTVGPNTLTQSVGIQIYNTSDFAWNFGSTGSDIVGYVSGLLEQDNYFNVSSTQCRVEAKILSTYSQWLTNVLYTS